MWVLYLIWLRTWLALLWTGARRIWFPLELYAVCGLFLALIIPSVVQLVEMGTGSPLLDTAVYPLAYVPVHIRLQDFLLVPGVALALSIVSCALPAFAAAKLPITEGLRESR